MITIDDILSRYWGFSSFRPLQLEIITSVLNGRDTVALLPTGGGKSLCFQIPSLASDGICIVVSPLVALMQDQVQELKNKGIKALHLSGGISFDELSTSLDNALYGNYKFLYLSPERLQQEIVQNYIREMKVNLIAVDEAHCISQWGYDFRPAYLNIVKLRELQPLAPFLALTATATPEVLTDTIEQLKLELPQVFQQSFIRKNISYQVLFEDDKIYKTVELLRKNTGSAIVYIRNRQKTIEISEQLNAYGINSSFYHGGLTTKEKKEKLLEWKSGRISTIVATNAFGMGIDHANVRFVIHLQLPESMESYFQEAGRAGRDGEYSEAIIIYNSSDKAQLHNQFISSLPEAKDVKQIYKHLNNYFQISYGEGQNEMLPFSFLNFVKTYQLNASLTYNTLKSLDRVGVIQLSEEFNRKTIVRFKLSSSDLLDYFQRDVRVAVIGKTLLRLYEGIYSLPIAINLDLVSARTGQSVDTVIQVLEQMKKEEVLELQLFHTDSSIIFLVPREDDRTINPIIKEIRRINDRKVDQVKAMIAYVENLKECRSTQLVRYFGEKDSLPCEICSVCLSKNKPKKKAKPEDIIPEILHLLEENPLNSRELKEILEVSEERLLEALQILIANEKIGINSKNQFIKPSK